MKQWTRQGRKSIIHTTLPQERNSKEIISESAKERRKIKNGNKYTREFFFFFFCTNTNKFIHGCHYILNQTTNTNPIQCVWKSRNTEHKNQRETLNLHNSWFFTNRNPFSKTQWQPSLSLTDLQLTKITK